MRYPNRKRGIKNLTEEEIKKICSMANDAYTPRWIAELLNIGTGTIVATAKKHGIKTRPRYSREYVRSWLLEWV